MKLYEEIWDIVILSTGVKRRHAHARTHALMHVRMYTHTHVHTYACIHIRIYTRTHVHTYACTHVRMHTHTHTHTAIAADKTQILLNLSIFLSNKYLNQRQTRKRERGKEN